jgi:hypothetical protein
VTIEATFDNLTETFGALREAIQSLRLTVVEDRPLDDGVLIIERMSDAIDNISGWLEEGAVAASRASQAVAHPLDGHQAIQDLSEAHDRFIKLEHELFFGLASYPQLTNLAKLGKSRGGEWRAWSGTVGEALDQTGHAASNLQRAFLAGWQELAERLGSGGSISLRTTNIGQQISTPITKNGGDARKG